jgi:hypothetical protein
MAISKNPLLKGVRGTINKQLVIREYFNKTVLSACPDMSNRILSGKQIRQNNILTKANIEVRAILNNEQKRNEAQIRLNVQRNRLRSALLSEVMLRLGKEN